MTVLAIVLLALLHLAVLAGLAAVVLGLSGNFILLGLALAVAWIGGFEHLGFGVLLLLLGLALFGELVEMLLGVAMARRFGATRWGMIGTFIGGLVGAAVGTAWIPILGSLIGAIVGAFAGAFAGETLRGARAREGARAGTGALVGRLAATAFKLVIGLAIAFFTLKAAYAAL
jgi:uncharacterized protein YqgC (DUF456 family)